MIYSQEIQEVPPPEEVIEEYGPLTPEEAETWLRSVTLEELIDWVILWDYIEHSAPVLNDFNYIMVLTDTDVAMIPRPEAADMTMGFENTFFTYKIKLPTFTYKNVIEPPVQDRFWLGIGIGFGTGLLVGGLVVYGFSALFP